MVNVKLRELNHFMTLAVYKGGVTAFRGSWDATQYVVKQEALPIVKTPEGQRERFVEDVIKLSDERFIIVGSGEFLPLTVVVTRSEDRKINVSFVFGEAAAVQEDDDRWPHVDKLTNTTFAMSYENGNSVYARVGRWIGQGTTARLELTEAKRMYTRFDFHGVAGLDESHFIMAVTGNYNQSQGSWPVVGAVLATIEGNDIKLGKWKFLPFTFSHNFFDMDNFGRDDVIMVFANAENAGINTVLIHYDVATNDIYFGAHRMIQNGGAVLDYNRIDIRVLSPTTFAVFYEDNAIERLVLLLCTVTNTKDIVVSSPKYVVSRGSRGMMRPRHRTWYDICESGWGDFNMIEYTEVQEGPRTFKYALVHRGVVQARLFGIAQKSKNGWLEVQFAGMFEAPKGQRFTPGRAVFTNSKGELVEGAPYGYANRDFGSFYEFNRQKQEIYAHSNVVGMAVTRRKIYMKF